MIGITIAIVWSVGELLARQPRARAAAPWVGAVLGVILIVMTWMQVSYWKTDFTLFERSAQVIPKNYFAYNQLGAAYREKREPQKAEFNFAESLKFNPDYDFGNNNLGVSLMERGDLNGARKHFEHAAKVNGQFVPPLRNLALLLAATGHPAEAAPYCERVITLQPGNASAQAQLGSIYEQLGRFAEAEQRFKFSLALDPFDPRATRLFGIFLANRGDLNNATKLLTRVVSELDPNDADAWNALGVMLAQQGDKTKGIACLEKALMIAPQHPQARQNLAALRGQP
jgi:Flp pilus assembly protein TadD